MICVNPLWLCSYLRYTVHTPPADNGGELKFAAGSQRKVGWGWLAAIEASQGLYLENIQTELYILPLFVTMVTAQSDHDQHHHVSNHQQDADLSMNVICDPDPHHCSWKAGGWPAPTFPALSLTVTADRRWRSVYLRIFVDANGCLGKGRNMIDRTDRGCHWPKQQWGATQSWRDVTEDKNMRIASFSTIKQDDHELPIGGDDTCQMIESKCRPLQEEHLGPLGLVTVTQPLKVFSITR